MPAKIATKQSEMVDCQWCKSTKVHIYAVKYDGELLCRKCQSYAWSAIVYPATYEANRAIAIRRFSNNQARG